MDQAFLHDGGEIIFNLPNGMQAYMLINGQDERIDEGPIDVVRDTKETSGTPIIVNGLSCMACHKHGMFPPPDDKVRAGTGVFGEVLEKVEELYPPTDRMNELLAQDTRRFMVALEQATGPFLKVGPDKSKPIESFPEPVSEIARFYRLKDLNLIDAASELYVSPEELRQRIQLNDDMRRLGLGVLLVENGAVKRHDWELIEQGSSLMQDTAQQLRFTALRVLAPTP
jgi:serine/threonine-protein kinase